MTNFLRVTLFICALELTIGIKHLVQWSVYARSNLTNSGAGAWGPIEYNRLIVNEHRRGLLYLFILMKCWDDKEDEDALIDPYLARDLYLTSPSKLGDTIPVFNRSQTLRGLKDPCFAQFAHKFNQAKTRSVKAFWIHLLAKLDNQKPM